MRILEQCIAEEDQLIGAQEHFREEFNNLIRMTQLKADEREQKCKDFLKAQVRKFQGLSVWVPPDFSRAPIAQSRV